MRATGAQGGGTDEAATAQQILEIFGNAVTGGSFSFMS